MRIATILALGLAACGTKGNDTGAGGDDGTITDTQVAETLWSDIAGYEAWGQVDGWQGVQPSADGTHGDYVQIWVNGTAQGVIDAAAGGDMENGAIIVKEGYSDDAGSDVLAVAVMKKISGFDSANGDWFWALYEPDGTVTQAGKVDGCVGCHSSGQDYVRFTIW